MEEKTVPGIFFIRILILVLYISIHVFIMPYNKYNIQNKEITNFGMLIYKTNMSILIKNHIPGSIFSSINPQKHIFYEIFSFFNNDLVK